MRMRMRMRMMLGLVLVSVGAGGLWGAGLRAPVVAAVLPLVSTVTVRLGEDARLRCPLLDDACAADNSTLSWYRTVGGGGPQMLLTVKSTADGSTVKLGAGLGPGKVAAAADGSLLLRRSDHRDAAVYYCGISQGGGDKTPGFTEA